MAFVITYVKVCLLLYYLVVNVVLRAMHIRNMYHDADLFGMVVLTLNFILWLKGVVFCKIHNWKYGPNGKFVLAFSVLLILPLCYMHMLNILLGFLVELCQKITYPYLFPWKQGSYLNVTFKECICRNWTCKSKNMQ